MRDRIPSLDGLRAIAILLVLGYHTPGSPITGGWLGVSVFFVLSGYLITSQLAEGALTWTRFMWRRFARLWPALAVVCLAVAALSLAAERSLVPVAAAALWVASPANLGAPGWDDVYLGHTWSLSVEAQFYAAWGLLMLGWPISRRRMLVGVALAAAVATLAVTTAVAGPRAAYFTLAGAGVPLLLGAWLRVAQPSLPRGAGWVSLAVLGIAALRAEAQTVAGLLVWMPLAAAAAATAVADVTAKAPPRVLAQSLALPVMQWIGARSYSIYLWHWPVIQVANHHGPVRAWWGGWLVTMVLAEVTYRSVEGPVRRWLLGARWRPVVIASRGAAARSCHTRP